LSVEILLFKILIFPPRGLCLPGHTNFRVSFVTYIFLGLSHFNEGNIPIKYNYKNEIPGIISEQAVSKFHDLY